MSEDLNKQLLEWAQKAVQFGVDNVPMVVDQYIQWWTWTHIMGIALGLLMLLGCYLGLRWTSKFWEDENNAGWIALSVVFSVVGGAVGLMILITNIYYLIKIRVAPVVYIIDSFIK